jgi:rubrerythrin
MQSRTRFNVEAALAGEAMAALRYQLFADAAIEEGHERIAELFAEAAMKERTQHFRELAILVGLVGPTRQNLRAALAGEVTEHRSLYPRFASQAHQDGEAEVAARFQMLGADEQRHADRLRDALEELDVAELEVVGG